MMEVSTYRRLGALEPTEWDGVDQGMRLAARHKFLAAVEASRINDCRYYYPVVRQKGNPVAHASIYQISTEIDMFGGPGLRAMVRSVRRIRKKFMIMRTVECGCPVALGNTIVFRPGSDRSSVLELILRAVERIAAEEGVDAIVFRDFDDDEVPFYERVMRSWGYHKIHNLPSAHLRIRWETFDDYLRAMRSQYRYKIRARMQRFGESGARMFVMDDFSDRAVEMARLWRNVYDQAKEYQREVIGPDFFVNVGRIRGTSALMVEINGRLVAFSLLIDDGETLEQLYCGLDYEINRSAAVYFNMLYKIVKMAIDRGYRKVDFGITTLIPKLDVGAEAVPLYMFMKHRQRVWNWIAPRIFDMMTSIPTERSRRVFKDGG